MVEPTKDDDHDDNNSSNHTEQPHARYAGRFPAGTAQPVTLHKDGPIHVSNLHVCVPVCASGVQLIFICNLTIRSSISHISPYH